MRRKVESGEEELLYRCKEKDIEAFEVLVRRYQKQMLNIAYRMIGDYDEACEVVQDAFLSAYKNIRRFKGKAKFSTWLCTIVLNLSKNRLRQLRTWSDKKQLSNDPLPLQTASPQEDLERREIQRKVQECIGLLDLEFREVIILRDIQGLSYEEISEALKIPGGTVKSRLFRAREALRDCLKKAMGDL